MFLDEEAQIQHNVDSLPEVRIQEVRIQERLEEKQDEGGKARGVWERRKILDRMGSTKGAEAKSVERKIKESGGSGI